MATNNSDQSLEQLENLLATYDDRALELIQNHLKTHSTDNQKNKVEEHESVREILDKIHQLQHHALRVGQVNIVDHHRADTRVFIASPNGLHIWQGGELQRLPQPSNSTTVIHSMDFHSYTGGDGKIWQYLTMVTGNDHILTINLASKSDYYATNTPIGTMHSVLHVFPNEYHLLERELAIVKVTFEDGKTNHGPTTMIRHGHSEVTIPGGLGAYQAFRGRMTFDFSGKQLYIADPGHGIRRVNVEDQKPTVTNLFDSFPVKNPIDIAFDQELRLLVVLDAATRKIYGSLVDRQQSYPSFHGFEQALELPEAILTNGASFTYSCWLKRGSNRTKDWKKNIPESFFGFYMNEDDNEITIHYHADGEPQTCSFKAVIPTSDWFHFAWIKRDEHFDFLVGGWAYRQPAPKRINLNRELPNKDLPILFCVPGYIAAELSVWDHDLSNDEIQNGKSTWRTGMPTGLTGYWHLQVSNRETIWKQTSHSFRDASGHGQDLSGQHLTWQLAPSPLDALLPLYAIPGKDILQGLTIDDTLNQLYWSEVMDNNQTRLMRGSTLGHTVPVVLRVLKFPVVALRVESNTNNAYEDLILAHARRRKVMREAIDRATKALEQHALNVGEGHAQVINTQENMQESLAQAAASREELTTMLEKYHEVIDAAHQVEKQKEGEVGQARLNAIEQARKLVSDAHVEAAGIRRNGGGT